MAPQPGVASTSANSAGEASEACGLASGRSKGCGLGCAFGAGVSGSSGSDGSGCVRAGMVSSLGCGCTEGSGEGWRLGGVALTFSTFTISAGGA